MGFVIPCQDVLTSIDTVYGGCIIGSVALFYPLTS